MLAGKWRAIGPCVRVAGGGVVNGVSAGAQIAVAELHRRDRDSVRVGLVIHGSQIIGEEKELVLFDRTANLAAHAIVSQMADRQVEKAARVESAVLMQFVRAAVPPIRTRFQHHVGDHAAGAAQLRLMIADRDTDHLDGLGRRNQDLEKPGALVVVDALDLVIITVPHLAVDFRLK